MKLPNALSLVAAGLLILCGCQKSPEGLDGLDGVR
jgi:hypothetical protein